MWKPQKAKEQVLRRIVKLLTDSSKPSLTTDQIAGFLREASDCDVHDALLELRNSGILACTDKRWWLRNRRNVQWR